MIRIRTNLENGQVFTIYGKNQWITMTHTKATTKNSSSISSESLMEAGENHLRAALKLKGMSHVDPGTDSQTD